MRLEDKHFVMAALSQPEAPSGQAILLPRICKGCLALHALNAASHTQDTAILPMDMRYEA